MQDLQPDNLGQGVGLPGDQPVDKEGAMAKADLYKLANYSFKLFKKIQDEDQMEAWVQAKITKAADYIASVYHYLEYEMEFSEYGKKIDNNEMYNESQKAELKAKLNEAKEMVKKLKVEQAEKLSKKDQKVSEGIFGGDQQACEACGGTGHVMTPERQVPEATKEKVAKYNRKAKAFNAASKRIDKNKNGIPDDEEFAEDQGELKKPGDTFKTQRGVATKTSTGLTHKRVSRPEDDEDYVPPKKPSKAAKSSAEKAGDRAADKAQEKSSKEFEKKHPGSVKRYQDGKLVEPGKKKEKEIDEMYGQGIYEGKVKEADLDLKELSDKEFLAKYKKTKAEMRADLKKVDEGIGKKVAHGIGKVVKKVAPNWVEKHQKADDEKHAAAKKAAADKFTSIAQRDTKKVDEAAKSPKAKKDYDKDGKVESEKDEVIGSRRKAAGLDEAAPSAGMSKKEKSAVVKKAKAGEDIGKPGKGFEKVEKAAKAGGAKDPKAVAAAAMWKTAKKKAVKENAEMIPQVEPSQEDPGMSEENMADDQFKAALEKAHSENPQALAAALNNSDPVALKKLLGAEMGAGEAKPELTENAELDKIKMLSGLK